MLYLEEAELVFDVYQAIGPSMHIIVGFTGCQDYVLKMGRRTAEIGYRFSIYSLIFMGCHFYAFYAIRDVSDLPVGHAGNPRIDIDVYGIFSIGSPFESQLCCHTYRL